MHAKPVMAYLLSIIRSHAALLNGQRRTFPVLCTVLRTGDVSRSNQRSA